MAISGGAGRTDAGRCVGGTMTDQDDPDELAEMQQCREDRRETFDRLAEERAEQRWWQTYDKRKEVDLEIHHGSND